jgi:hypothetical protein
MPVQNSTEFWETLKVELRAMGIEPSGLTEEEPAAATGSSVTRRYGVLMMPRRRSVAGSPPQVVERIFESELCEENEESPTIRAEAVSEGGHPSELFIRAPVQKSVREFLVPVQRAALESTADDSATDKSAPSFKCHSGHIAWRHRSRGHGWICQRCLDGGLNSNIPVPVGARRLTNQYAQLQDALARQREALEALTDGGVSSVLEDQFLSDIERAIEIENLLHFTYPQLSGCAGGEASSCDEYAVVRCKNCASLPLIDIATQGNVA